MRVFEHKHIQLNELQTQTINGKRHYLTDEGYFPSITSVLSVLSIDGIKAWRARVGEKEANKISTQAARRGTNVHQMCEDYINNELNKDKFLPHEIESFIPLQKELDKSIGLVYAQEVPMYSTYLGVAGRVDLIAEWDGRLSIIDFKTSRKVKKKEWISGYFQQGAAYAVMFEERTGIPVDKIVIAMTVDGESDASVFVEKRDNWVSTLQETIQLYEDRYGIPRS
jgi:hypothetical protein